jgi:iron complex transport system substrate-binding protein
LNDYHQRIQDFQQKMGNRLSMQVSVIHPLREGTRIMYKEFFGGSIIQDAGLARPSEQDQDGYNSQPVSSEWIPQMDGDVIFSISFKDEESLDLVEQLQNHPLWSQLEAVKQGKVYSVNAEHWYGGDIVAANLVLDDLFQYLLAER